MSEKDKSVLDNVPVKEDTEFKSLMKTGEKLSVIGACPQCGSPIYGPHSVKPDETPQVKHSCTCWRPPPRPVQQMMETKEGR